MAKITWKVKKKDNSIEKQLLIGLIVSDTFTEQIARIYDPDLIELPYVKIVAQWCLDYFAAYDKVPGTHIKDLYDSHVRDETVGADEELVGEFIAQLSEEFEHSAKFNVDYLLDQCVLRFRNQKLKNLVADINAAVSAGMVDEAEERLSQFNRIQLGSGSSVDPFSDFEAISEAFDDDVEPLFKFQGALGELINPLLTRDSLIGIMGPEKRGKTWWLIEFAGRALRQRCNVAFFAVGDMSKSQMIRRFLIWLAGRSHKQRYCGKLVVPMEDCFKNQLNTCRKPERMGRIGILEPRSDGKNPLYYESFKVFQTVVDDYEPCSVCLKDDPRQYKGAVWYHHKEVEPLTAHQAYEISSSFMSRLKGRSLRLDCQPNSSVNVTWIEGQLSLWETEGFIPDVIVIDYADILAAEPGSREFRHQQNETWKALRRLSQKRHCLVVTATQADADSYTAPTMKLSNFSEDKRKYAHVTAMLTLNQLADEKKANLMRIGLLLARDDEFDSSRTVHVLQQLSMGRPNLASFW